MPAHRGYGWQTFPGAAPSAGVLVTAPWTPLNLANLIGFWRADMGVSTSGSNVTSWTDQSPAGNNLTVVSASVPTWSSTGFNTSYPGVFFNGGSGLTNEYIGNTSFTFASTVMSSFVLFYANSTQGSGINGTLYGLIASGGTVDYTLPGFQMFLNDTPVIACESSSTYFGNGGSALAYTKANPHLFGCVCDGAHGNYFLDSATASGSAVSFSSTLGTSPNSFYLGGTPSGNQEITGTIAFALMTSGAISVGDIGKLITWTNANWGLSLGP